ncbi:MAG: hypothetical protein FJ110_18625 [Deltaproteobacteria bacterium]|nr:hypothetical protein [Deltaproteobacteria bacterium]
MPEYPPFMNAYGNVGKILEKVKHAKTPDRFTYDFLSTTLGFKSSSARAFVPLAKRIGFLASDGSPTDLYKSFRNPPQSGGAMAKAIRKGYTQLFERNESAYKLNKKDLEGLLVEITGLEKNQVTIRSIIGTFEALKLFAKFDEEEKVTEAIKEEEEVEPIKEVEGRPEELKLNLAYTINLVLPKTDDVAVFNAIFKSLRENLLRK